MTSKEIAQRLSEITAEKEKLESELLKTIERESEERQQNECKAIKKVIHELWKKYWNNDDFENSNERLNSYTEKYQLEIWLESDIKAALKECNLKNLDEIRDIVNECNAKIDWQKCIQDVKIRLDFAEALRNVKQGTDLSAKLGYGFGSDDLMALMKLHKANKFRKKIEDLLTDCNFHSESGMLSEKKYDEYEHFILKEA